jgi:hypothetical protein
LTVRTVSLALGIRFNEGQVLTVVEALVGDDGRFDGTRDVTTAQLAPERVLDQIRLYGDLLG